MIKQKILAAIIVLLLAFAALNFRITPAYALDISVRALLEPSLEADRVYPFSDGIAAVRVFDSEGGFSLGYVNRYGQFIIPFITYPLIPNWHTPQFSHGLVAVYSPDEGATGFFDTSGGLRIPFLFDQAPSIPFEFVDGLAAVSVDGLWGFIDTFGEVQIPIQYEGAGDFSENLAPVLQDGRWGFVDTEGEIVIPFALDHQENGVMFINLGFSEGIAPVLLNLEVGPRWGFINRAGNRIHSYMYIHAEGFVESRALVMRITEDGMVFGFVDRSGDEIIPTMYSFARSFSNGLAAVQLDELWGFIDHYNSVQVPIRYDETRSFSGGFAAVRSGNRWGFIDRWGNEVVPLIYYEVGDFSGGLAPVRLGEGLEARWGFVDQTGNVVVAIEYLDAHEFYDGLAWVRGPVGWGILQIAAAEGQNGEYTPTETRYIYETDNHLFTPPIGTLRDIYNPSTADEAIFSIARSLTDEQRGSGDALNIAALFIENAIRRGSSQELPLDGILRAGMVQSAADLAQIVWQDALTTVTNENVHLLRQLGVNINFITEIDNIISMTFPDDVSGMDFDNLTVEASFAAVTLNRRHIPRGSEITISLGETTQESSQAAPANNLDSPVGFRGFISNFTTRLRGIFADFTFRGFLSSPIAYLIEFWAVSAFIFIILIWGTLFTFGHRFRLWVVPTFTLLVIVGNLWTLGLFQQSYHEAEALPLRYDQPITVTMSQGMRATISIPLGDADPAGLVLYNERGEAQLSKFNPVTNTIDARIHGGGTFTLQPYEVGFADIGGTNPIVQHAILTLASMGIMEGTGDNFRPAGAITRAELAAAVVSAFDLLSTTAPNNFTDNNPGDRYYHAINTAVSLGLLHGFEDGTFRGSWAITKNDLVLAVAEAMAWRMGYLPPRDIEAVLALYQDRDGIALWAEEGIALATAANVVAFREDGLFAPDSVMSRGDAAVVIYRLFGRLW